MVTEVTAYMDDRGTIHKTRDDAVKAEFTRKIETAWNQMPSMGNKGDPKIIADMLFGPTYQSFKFQLREALDWLEEQKITHQTYDDG